MLPQYILQQGQPTGPGQVFQTEKAAMGFPLAPDYLLEIIIGGDDDPLLYPLPERRRDRARSANEPETHWH